MERDIELREDEVLVKTHQASICDADEAVYRTGHYLSWETPKFPRYPGHEGGGIIAEVGRRVHEYEVGDKVILMHYIQGGLAGESWLSGALEVGSMSNYFKAKPMDLIPVPKGLDMDIASLGEALFPFIWMVFRSGVKLGDTVAVTGAKWIGQIVVQGIKKSGAKRIIVLDNVDERLELAKNMGADIIINTEKQNAQKEALDITDGKGADVVCQTAAYGHPKVEEYTNLATEIVKTTGILSFCGDFLTPITLKNLHRWHHSSLDIRSIAFRHYSWQQTHVWAMDCLKPIQENMIDVKQLITATYRLEDVAEAFSASVQPEAIKITIKP